MPELDKIREDVDAIYRDLNLVALRLAAERDEGALAALQEESFRLQSQLHRDEARLRAELKRVGAGLLGGDPETGPSEGGDAEDKRPTGAGDERMGAATTGLDVKVELRMLNVPTSIVHLLARRKTPLVTVLITNTDDKMRRISVTTYVEGFSAQAVTTREIPPDKVAAIDHFPAFFPDRIATLNELTTAMLHVKIVDLDGAPEHHESYPIPLLARTTGVLFTHDPSDGAQVDLRDLLAAWVTPNAPEVLDLLRRCADLATLKAMLGYQTDADGVREHVRAIFNALKATGIVYINTPVAFGNYEGQFIQRVRLPRESIANRSANCLDGTVLMASLLEATALDPAIVLVPGHAYLAWRPRRPSPGEPDAWEYVETTMIGTGTFEEARLVAEHQTAAQIERMRSNPGETYVKILPISKLRGAGITPME